MKCERIGELLMDSLMGRLETADRVRLEDHLQRCPRCREEEERLENLWQDLGELESTPEPVPSARLTARFQTALEDFGTDRERTSGHHRLAEWWRSLWPAQPVWQAAFSAAVLLLGVFIGAGASSLTGGNAEVDSLRADVEAMNRLVTVSLLEHHSVTERLRGASYSRLTEPDDKVLAALLGTARQDPNINVRLAAIEALTPFATRPSVRAGLLDSLPAQSSPLVQLAVLEAVVGDNGVENGELERLLRSGDLDKTVLEHVLGGRAQNL
jgi:hypothetical protein